MKKINKVKILKTLEKIFREVFDDEKLKIWPMDIEVKMNGLIRKSKDLMQDFEINTIEKISPTKYHISGRSSSEGTILIKGSALVYLI